MNACADAWGHAQSVAHNLIARGAGASLPAWVATESSAAAYEVDRQATAAGLTVVWHGQRQRWVLARKGGRVNQRWGQDE